MTGFKGAFKKSQWLKRPYMTIIPICKVKRALSFRMCAPPPMNAPKLVSYTDNGSDDALT